MGASCVTRQFLFFFPCFVHRFVPGKGKIFVVTPDLMDDRLDRLECKFSVVNFQADFALEEILLQAMAKEPLKLQALSVTKIFAHFFGHRLI